MNIRKHVLNELKRCEFYYETGYDNDSNITAVKNIVNYCIKLLESNINEEEERASKYMDKLLKDLK